MEKVDLTLIYSPIFSDKTRFPLAVRQVLDTFLSAQILLPDVSPQTKGRFIESLTGKIDALETSDPQLVENFGHYRDLFKRKKTELYDVLVKARQQETLQTTKGPYNELCAELVEAINQDNMENDSVQQVTAKDESEVDDSMEGISSVEEKVPEISIKQARFVPLSHTLAALDRIIVQKK